MRLELHDGLTLSDHREGDEHDLVQGLNDREIYQYMLRVPYPYTLDDAVRFLGIVRQATEEFGHPVHYAIRDDSDKLIGGFGFDGLHKGHCVQIGYWLAKSHWGLGIMTQVISAGCDYASREWDLVRISAHVFINNQASARVLEKNGFNLEGILKKYHEKDGQFIDSRLYAKIKTERTAIR